MNIIFVDIDGPLIPQKLHLIPQNRKTSVENPPVFDQFSVIAFNHWAKYADAQIVFSTNWALSYTEEQLKDIMAVNGLEFNYHEHCITPKRFTSQRHTEILDWLAEYSNDGDTFIAVDDDTSCKYIQKILDNKDCDNGRDIKATGKWIEIDFRDGMTYQNYKDGVDVLGIIPGDIMEQEYGIKKLTPEEIEERKKGLEMLAYCIF